MATVSPSDPAAKDQGFKSPGWIPFIFSLCLSVILSFLPFLALPVLSSFCLSFSVFLHSCQYEKGPLFASCLYFASDPRLETVLQDGCHQKTVAS